jgi:16S rRNA (guanine(966)-N(2))-methyltransferase RsmD
MSLKISGGIYKGLRLETPSGDITRPTSEILRTAVFNICQHRIEGANFLDLYAGSGAIGIEALSRGASHCTFVEKNRNALLALKKNIEKTSLQASTTLLPYDVQLALKTFKDKPFDLVYIDPPYGEKHKEQLAEKMVESLLMTLDTKNLLNPEAWVFLEFSSYSKKDFSQLDFQHLKWDNTRTFARSVLYLFKRTNPPNS